MRCRTSLLTLALLGPLAPSVAREPGPPPLDTRAVARALLDAHNRERAAEKLPPMTLDPALTAAAQVHADDMAAYHEMSHEGSDKSSPFDRIKREGVRYQSAAENVAAGQTTVASAMRSWMESPPHRANILGKFTRAGFAVATDDDGTPYWCADFATPWPKLDPPDAAADLVRSVNAERASAAKTPLRHDEKLSEAATRVAREMARAEGKDSSGSPGTDLGRALKDVGYRFRMVGVSAASGQPGAKAVLKSWVGDEATRRNLLGEFTEAGGGYSVSESGRPYWCLILAQPAGQ